jgi:hypothetical protein
MFCRTYGGHLASLASSKELSFVQKLCNGNVSSCWIGGRSMNSSTSGFRWSWSDPKTPQWNQSMFPKVPIRTRCGNGNGSSSCRANICIAVTNGSSSIFGERCNASHAFVCAVDSGNGLSITTSLSFFCILSLYYLVPYNCYLLCRYQMSQLSQISSYPRCCQRFDSLHDIRHYIMAPCL